MVGRFASGHVPASEISDEDPEKDLIALWQTTRVDFLSRCEGFQFHTALERLFVFIKSINAYIEKRAPWKLAKSADPVDAARLRTALATMAEALRLGTAALRPVMPGAADKIMAVLGAPLAPSWNDELHWGCTLTGAKVAAALVLFPRPEKR
jgi:methionyl-tRNA synthetase